MLAGNAEPTTENVEKFVRRLRLTRSMLDLVAELPAAHGGSACP